MLIPLNSIVQFSMKSQLWLLSPPSPPLRLTKVLTLTLAGACSFSVPQISLWAPEVMQSASISQPPAAPSLPPASC